MASPGFPGGRGGQLWPACGRHPRSPGPGPLDRADFRPSAPHSGTVHTRTQGMLAPSLPIPEAELNARQERDRWHAVALDVPPSPRVPSLCLHEDR